MINGFEQESLESVFFRNINFDLFLPPCRWRNCHHNTSLYKKINCPVTYQLTNKEKFPYLNTARKMKVYVGLKNCRINRNT